MPVRSALRPLLILLLGCLVSCATPSAGANPNIAGEWVGRYVCAQGVTSLTLSVADRNGSRETRNLTATFAFSEAPENPGLPSGSFTMRGFYYPQTRILVLWPGQWLERPGEYEMVSIHGRMTRDAGHADTIRGRVEFPGDINACSTFTVTRRIPEVASRGGARV